MVIIASNLALTKETALKIMLFECKLCFLCAHTRKIVKSLARMSGSKIRKGERIVFLMNVYLFSVFKNKNSWDHTNMSNNSWEHN